MVPPAPRSRLDAFGQKLVGSRWAKFAVRLVAFLLLAYLALRLREFWRQSPADFSHANLAILVVAAIVSLVAVVSYGSVWPVILKRIGAPVPSDAVRVFLQAQLGKYVPGSVWQYAGRIGLARARGVTVRLGMISLAVEVAASATAAAIVGLFVLPVVVAVPLALVIAVVVAGVAFESGVGVGSRLVEPLVRITRRIVPVSRRDLRPALRASSGVTALYVPIWIVYGLAFWLTARALFPVPTSEIVYFAAVFALGWLAGMIAVFAPGGIGVREAVLASLLAPRLGHTEAIVVAGASRVLLTTADLLAGGVAIALSRVGSHRIRIVVE